MQHDEVIWQVINHGHCTYKVKTKTQNFCRNKYNVTGLCNRSSCPLANSRYATIQEENGRIYLYIKTIERAHLPNKLWQKIRLKRQYASALAQIDEHLQYWPKFLVHKNKQRLTKITQYLIRMRRLATKTRTKLVPLATRTEKREKRRETKAETAAQLETSIEAELLQRLKAGTYGDIYNIPHPQYEKVLDEQEQQMEAEAEEEFVEGDEESEEEQEEEEEIEYLNEDEVNFDDAAENEDLEDFAGDDAEAGPSSSASEGEEADADPEQPDSRPSQRKRRAGTKSAGRKRQRHMELEYEEEREPLQQPAALREEW